MTADSVQQRPKWPKRGDIMMARPLFHSDKGHWPLAQKEHPVLVLKVAKRDDSPDSPVMAIVVPLTHSESSQRKPNHLPVLTHQVKRMTAHAGKQSHICTDSPNIITLNAPDNGVRPPAWAPEWVSPYTHGRITDPALVDAAEALTKTFLAETQYQPPIQGTHASSPSPRARHKVGTELSWATRVCIVEKAAQAEASRATKGLERLNTALARAGLGRPVVGQEITR